MPSFDHLFFFPPPQTAQETGLFEFPFFSSFLDSCANGYCEEQYGSELQSFHHITPQALKLVFQKEEGL